MPLIYHRPENALKRAEELIAVGQQNAALQSLHEIITSRKARMIPLTSLEPIMLKFIELCVSLKKGKTAKEGLHQYRNITQNTNITTIETVVNRLLNSAEKKLEEAQLKADQINLESIEDLEATETPESILLSTVSGDQSRDRTDRSVVTPWLRFLWETYRNVLDILRNNARLEILYQNVVNQAFSFCSKYVRKTEFRRLCEILRIHLSNVIKYSHQTHSVNLGDPESLQRHMIVRFNQLEISIQMELWQEAFRSVEDVHNLLVLSKKPPKASILANYYKQLTSILMVSGNHLFHAAAWLRYYMVIKHNPKIAAGVDIEELCSNVLLSVLAVPVIHPSGSFIHTKEMDELKIKSSRLSLLLGLSQTPTRSQLLSDLVQEDIISKVRPELKELYNILEVQFHPLSICKKVSPIMANLSERKFEQKYVEPLHHVILSRLVQELSQVYSTIKLEFIVQLASFPAPFDYDASRIERFIMNGCRRGELAIKIDHNSRSIIFDHDPFDESTNVDSDCPSLQPLPSELVRNQLSTLSRNLGSVVYSIMPEYRELLEQQKADTFKTTLETMEEEHQHALSRNPIIERRKELMETLMMRKEKEEAREKMIRIQKEQEAQKLRLAEEQKKREAERRMKEIEAIQKEEARKLAESLKAKSGIDVNIDELKNLDKDQLLEIQVEQLEKEKSELQNKLKAQAKKLDHTERAYRKEEIALLEKDYENQKKQDYAYHKASLNAKIELSKQKHIQNMKIKQRLSRMNSDYANFKRLVSGQREKEVQDQRRLILEKINEEKALRLDTWKELTEKKRIKEEHERQQKEEAEKKRLEQERILKEKKAAELEERRKLDEVAALQRKREAEAEARRQERLREKEAQRAAASRPAAAPYRRGGLQATNSRPITRPTSVSNETPKPSPVAATLENGTKPQAYRPGALNRSSDAPAQTGVYRPGSLNRSSDAISQSGVFRPSVPPRSSETPTQAQAGTYRPGAFSRTRTAAPPNSSSREPSRPISKPPSFAAAAAAGGPPSKPPTRPLVSSRSESHK